MAQAIEEPTYELVRQIDQQVELRRYAPYVVAEVAIDTRAADAGNQAFPILAGYIFGKNTLGTAPEPLEPRVRLREEPAPVRAAIRYPVGVRLNPTNLGR